jgi:hypothetical protein
MFYHTELPAIDVGDRASAMVSLTPSESKRLIARAVAVLPEVRQALDAGLVIVARGTTNAFVAEEIAGIAIASKADEYARGMTVGGELRANSTPARDLEITNDLVLRRGKADSARPQDAIAEFTSSDVFIKGANAVDATGQAAVLAAGPGGGTIGWAQPVVTDRAAHLIVPVGLEKLVPSMSEAAQRCREFGSVYTTGLPCILIPLAGAIVVTEVQALAVLAGVSAIHIASGGIGGSEGAVVLHLEGAAAAIKRSLDVVKAVKGEPAVPAPRRTLPPPAAVDSDRAAAWRRAAG